MNKAGNLNIVRSVISLEVPCFCFSCAMSLKVLPLSKCVRVLNVTGFKCASEPTWRSGTRPIFDATQLDFSFEAASYSKLLLPARSNRFRATLPSDRVSYMDCWNFNGNGAAGKLFQNESKGDFFLFILINKAISPLSTAGDLKYQFYHS